MSWRFQRFTAQNVTSDTFFSVVWLLISFRQRLQEPKGSPQGKVWDGTGGAAKRQVDIIQLARL